MGLQYRFTEKKNGQEATLLYTCRPGDSVDDPLYTRLRREEIPHLLPVKRLSLEKVHFMYDVSFLMKLSEYKEMLPEKALDQLRKKRRDHLMEIIDQGIPLHTVITDDKYVYYDEAKEDICFLCLPLGKNKTDPVNNLFDTVRQGNGLPEDAGKLPQAQPAQKAVLRRTSDGTCYPFVSSALKVGRRQGEADAWIPDNPQISRLHCILFREGGRYYIQDLHSVNGTSVNHRKLLPEEIVELASPSLITLADEEFQFELLPER